MKFTQARAQDPHYFRRHNTEETYFQFTKMHTVSRSISKRLDR